MTFVEDVDSLRLEEIGPFFEYHQRFMPYRVNTEFVQVLDRTHLKVRVWERGSGETLACGTGACAAVAVCVRLKKCARGLPVNVRLPGGVLTVCCGEDGEITLSGGAAFVYDGVFDFADERGGGDHFGH